jgi:type VI secretion system protein ImpA
MARIDLSKITEPLGEDQPCGPDLDMEYDMDFMNLVAELEGVLPTSYFRFDAGGLDFESFYNRIGEQLERTHDLRMLLPLAKLRILEGDLGGCAEAIDAMRKLLTTFWTDAHPQALDGDWTLRTSQLLTLDDNPNMVLPMQHAAIVRSRRAGTINLRKWQLATGELHPREGEEIPDAGSITSAFSEAEDAEIEQAVASLELIEKALAEIQRITVSEAGYENAVTLERLPKTIEGMLELIRSATGSGEAAAEAGEAGVAGEGGTPGAVLGTVVLPPGAVKSRAEAKKALDVAHAYFLVKEPSNPAPLLLREVMGLIDKGFYSVISELMPSEAGSSVFRFGRDPFIEVSLPDMDSRNPAPGLPAEEGASDSWAETGLGDDDEVSGEVPDSGNGGGGAASADDGAADDTSEPAEAEGAEASDADDGSGDAESAEADADAGEDAVETEAGSSEAPDEYPEESPPPQAVAEVQETEDDAKEEAETGPQFWANTRPEAIALIEKVIAYYQVAEPTSPVPLLLERAIQLSTMKFMDLLENVLPTGSLRRPDSGY